jgi:hypothetical protein
VAHLFHDRQRARLFIGDTGGLMTDVVQATRRGQTTSFLAALTFGSVLLYLPRHVLIEVERNLPKYARRRTTPVDPDLAMQYWQTLYAPHARVVDVPDSWGADDPRVEAVAGRHRLDAPVDKFSDAPTARLALALADCYVISRDRDLTDHSFGHLEHLDLMHAAANEGEMQYVGQMAGIPFVFGGLLVQAASQGFRRLPFAGQVLVLAAAGALGYAWQREGRAVRHIQQLGSVAGDVVKIIAPPLGQLHARMTVSAPVWTRHVVQRRTPATVSEQAARILACSPEIGMLAGEIAEELDVPGSLKSRTVKVRAALQECEAFRPVSRGRWRLGEPATVGRGTFDPEMLMEWMRRTHAGVIPDWRMP